MAKADDQDLADLKAQVQAQAAQLEAMKGGAVNSSALDLLARASAPRDNPDYNEISAFTYPEGERVRPKPKLTRDTFFCGTRQRDDQLSPAEIEAFNAITVSRTARNHTWSAQVTQNGTRGELHVNIPNRTIDDRMNHPVSLLLILGELEYGAKAVDPAAMAARLAELEDVVSQLTR